MRPGETLIEMARRHVAEGEAHVRRQHEIIAHLDDCGLPTGMAQKLLHDFEQSLEDHRASLRRMQDEQGQGLRDASGQLRPRA